MRDLVSVKSDNENYVVVPGTHLQEKFMLIRNSKLTHI